MLHKKQQEVKLIRHEYPDEELVEQIRENPYYQYFIGMPGYEDKIPFVPLLLVEFRKRLSEILNNHFMNNNQKIKEINEKEKEEET